VTVAEARNRSSTASIDVATPPVVDQGDPFTTYGERRPRRGGSVKDVFGPHRVRNMVLTIVSGQATRTSFLLFMKWIRPRYLETLPIHWTQLLLQPGLAFKFSELWRQARLLMRSQ
jgi:hypothetical protein